MEKRAQVQLSFGMIFSVVIIIATLSVAGYVIYKFVHVDYGLVCRTYRLDLQNKIDKLWAADAQQVDVFSGEVTGKTKKVCFGNMTQEALTPEDKKTLEEIQLFANRKSNLVFYPKGACGDSASGYVIDHIKTDNFFCVPVSNSKTNVRLSIGAYDNSVKLSK